VSGAIPFRLRFAFVALVVALAGWPAPAHAEWQITPMLGVTFRGNTTLIDPENATGAPHKEFGGAVTFLSKGLFGVEGVLSVTPGFFHVERPRSRDGEPLPTGIQLVTGSYTLAAMGNVVVAAPRRYTEYFLRPFASAGLGVLRASETNVADLNVEATRLGFNVGGGAIGFLTAHTGVRFDLRYYSNVHRAPPRGTAVGPVHLRYLVASIGLVIRTSAPRTP
jgi:hypothetical protein